MSPLSPLSILATTLLLLTTNAATATATTTNPFISELISLRSRSKSSGIIHLNDNLVDRFVSSARAPRPYSLLLFFDAAAVRANHDINLPALRSKFGLVSAAFRARNPTSDTLFFCDIEYGESPRSFADFDVSSLPHVAWIGPERSEALPLELVAGSAEALAGFVEARTGLPVGPVERPSSIPLWWIAIFGILVAVSAPSVIRKVLNGETVLTDKKFWMVSTLVIYFFGISGSMHGIIRSVPMALPDDGNPKRLVFFYQGSDVQLGAEGIAIGSLYMVVGVILALVTHDLVRVEGVALQTFFMIAAMIVSAWAVWKVVYLDNWKTGYGVNIYWPSRWR